MKDESKKDKFIEAMKRVVGIVEQDDAVLAAMDPQQKFLNEIK